MNLGAYRYLTTQMGRAFLAINDELVNVNKKGLQPFSCKPF